MLIINFYRFNRQTPTKKIMELSSIRALQIANMAASETENHTFYLFINNAYIKLCILHVLMDICLPDMDGLEIACEIKSDASMSDIPIIALTACAMEGDKDYFLSEGCEGYLSKPISVNGFLQYVQKYLH